MKPGTIKGFVLYCRPSIVTESSHSLYIHSIGNLSASDLDS